MGFVGLDIVVAIICAILAAAVLFLGGVLGVSVLYTLGIESSPSQFNNYLGFVLGTAELIIGGAVVSIFMVLTFLSCVLPNGGEDCFLYDYWSVEQVGLIFPAVNVASISNTAIVFVFFYCTAHLPMFLNMFMILGVASLKAFGGLIRRPVLYIQDKLAEDGESDWVIATLAVVMMSATGAMIVGFG